MSDPMPDLSGCDAVIVDIGGTLVSEAPPATATTGLVVTFLPGVLDDLRALAAVVRLAAATNTSVMREADVRGLLAPSGVSDLLEAVATSCEAGAAKPDPAVLRLALGRLGGVAAERALFIGDRATDAEAAAAIDMPFAWAHPDGLLAAIRARANVTG